MHPLRTMKLFWLCCCSVEKEHFGGEMAIGCTKLRQLQEDTTTRPPQSEKPRAWYRYQNCCCGCYCLLTFVFRSQQPKREELLCSQPRRCYLPVPSYCILYFLFGIICHHNPIPTSHSKAVVPTKIPTVSLRCFVATICMTIILIPSCMLHKNTPSCIMCSNVCMQQPAAAQPPPASQSQ